MDCLFCKIIAGEIPSFKIYEDKYTYAFLDIANDSDGHILVLPKKHCENMLDADSQTLAHVMESVQKIGRHLVENCGFGGFNVINNCGKDAEQSVMHLHFHILPRKIGNTNQIFPVLEKNDESLEEICNKLKFEEVTSSTKNVVLYTDGACSGNPGMGGWGAILMCGGREKVISGGEKETTNNRMELTAVIKGLEKIKGSQHVDVYSDSAYVVNAFLQDWISSWRAKGWKTTKGDVQNLDLWQQLIALCDKHNVVWHKVKGHADNEYNNRCDALAVGEIEKMRKEQ
ncbi:MAG: ribonuclease HI [Clostridia bacterium]|nr:ribonuclease HI [Clostridia bacterium]